MHAPPHSYAIFLFISASLTLISSIFAGRRKAPGSFTLSLLMLAMSFWAGFYALHWLPFSPEIKGILPGLTYMGVLALPPLFMIYALQFSNNERWLTPPFLSILAIEPLVTLLLLWTNRSHRLVFRVIYIMNESDISWMQLLHGPWYHFNLIYSYIVITLGFIVLLMGAYQSNRLLRKQYGVIIVASLVPWVGNMFSEFTVIPYGLDLTPVLFGIAGVIYSYAIVLSRVMDVIPVARSRLIESMSDGVLVLDMNNRIVDINPAMQDILQNQSSSYLGKTVSEALGTWLKNAAPLLNGEETRTELKVPNGPPRYLDLRVTPLYDHRQHLNGRLMVFRDITARKLAEKKLRYANERLQSQLIEIGTLQSKLRAQAIRDPLTNLFNRRYLDETLDRELARSAREGYPVCVIMMDIDHFKQVNDTYGHEAGDHILKVLANSLTTQNRRGDFACRYGGEEFVIVMPNITIQTACQRAEHLRTWLNSLQVQYGRFNLSTTLSIGIACYPLNGEDRETILRAADHALYGAKKAGRNQVFTYDQLKVSSENTG